MIRVLPGLPTIKDILGMYGLRAQKQLSQNFLLDAGLCDAIAQCVPPLENGTVIEVGPGPGGLTRSLLKGGTKHVVGVEMDRRFAPALLQLEEAVGPEALSLQWEDMLKANEEALLQPYGEIRAWEDDSQVAIVGNLPFGVATGLLLKWLRQLETRDGPFAFGRAPLTLMFQKEVAHRLVAVPGTSAYGRLSVMAQQSCDTQSLLTVPGRKFTPPPDVDATVVTLTPRKDPVPLRSLGTLEWLLREMFSLRRKVVRTVILPLERHFDAPLLTMAKIPGGLRPQELTVDEWCTLANIIHELDPTVDATTPTTRTRQKR